MNNIYYINDEALAHLDKSKKIKSLLWKIMYKRVKRNVNSSLINIENLKKIIFNKKQILDCTLNAPLPYVMIRNQATWYLADDSNEYFLPLSISFSDGKIRFDIVLLNGEIDIRIVQIHKDEYSSKHTPMLLVKNLEMLEICFKILLEEFEIK